MVESIPSELHHDGQDDSSANLHELGPWLSPAGCVYVGVHVYMCVFMCTCMWVLMCTCMCAHVYVYVWLEK